MRGTRAPRRRATNADEEAGARARRRARPCPRSSSAPSRTCTQKSVARKKKLVSCVLMRATSSRSASSSHARAPRDLVAATRPRAASPSSVPARQRRVQLAQRARDPVDVVGRDDDARARLADQLRRRAVGRHDREDRPLGREVLEHLAGEHALAAAAGLRDQQQQRLGVALQLERAAVRRVRDQLEPVAEPDAPRPTRGRRRGSRRRSGRRRRRARTAQRGQERPRVALAEERAGVRDPEALARACTRARRSRRSRSRSRSSRPARAASRARISSAIASETRDDRVGLRARPASRRACSPCSFARTSSRSASRCGCATSESRRSATQRRAGRALDRGADRCTDGGGEVVITTSIPSLAHDPDRGRDRGQVPADVLVGHEQPAAERAAPASRERSSPSVPCSSSAGLRPRGPR